jgi:sialic acid synthase SpsE
MFSQNFKISNFDLSNKSKSIIIAEIGINHEGNFLKCIKLIDEAKKTGANLVKLQVVDPHENYEKETSSFKIFNKSTLSDEEIFNIYNYCKKKKN